jgi:hypothetical protein
MEVVFCFATSDWSSSKLQWGKDAGIILFLGFAWTFICSSRYMFRCVWSYNCYDKGLWVYRFPFLYYGNINTADISTTASVRRTLNMFKRKQFFRMINSMTSLLQNLYISCVCMNVICEDNSWRVPHLWEFNTKPEFSWLASLIAMDKPD